VERFDEIIRHCCENISEIEQSVMVIIVEYKNGVGVADVMAPFSKLNNCSDETREKIVDQLAIESIKRGLPISVALVMADSESLVIMSGNGVTSEKTRIPRCGEQLVLDDMERGSAESDALIHRFWRGIWEATRMINPSYGNPKNN